MNPGTSVTKIRRLSDIMFTKFSGSGCTDSRIHHSFVDGQTQIQYAYGTVFQRWRRHKNAQLLRHKNAELRQ